MQINEVRIRIAIPEMSIYEGYYIDFTYFPGNDEDQEERVELDNKTTNITNMKAIVAAIEDFNNKNGY